MRIDCLLFFFVHSLPHIAIIPVEVTIVVAEVEKGLAYTFVFHLEARSCHIRENLHLMSPWYRCSNVTTQIFFSLEKNNYPHVSAQTLADNDY